MHVALHRLAIEGFWMVINYGSYGIAIPYGLVIQVIKKKKIICNPFVVKNQNLAANLGDQTVSWSDKSNHILHPCSLHPR
nr:hypothetical protein [Candidatus Sigynarchaeota archaeon]